MYDTTSLKNSLNEAINQLPKLQDWLRLAITLFNKSDVYYGHGNLCAYDEAHTLVFDALDLPHDLNASLLNSTLLESEKKQLADILHKRLIDKIPTPYLVNKAWLNGLDFYVTPDVLIPRSPLFELIDAHFEPWVNPEATGHILDLCTGSACLAIMCALNFPEAKIDAVDICDKALKVAKQNVENYQLDYQIELIQSDLLQDIGARKYDIILSNPPYVDQQDMHSLPKEYQHEPTLALAAGHDGLDIVHRIIQTAAQHLTTNGILIVEVGNSRDALTKAYPTLPFVWLEFEKGDTDAFILNRQDLP